MDHLDAIRRHVAAVIKNGEDFDEAVARRARAKEAEGYRIVDGGKVGSHVDGLAPWELTDWHTGHVLVTGTGLDSFQAMFETERWWHIDALAYDLGTPTPLHGDLPPGLAQALERWASADPVEAELWLAGLEEEG